MNHYLVCECANAENSTWFDDGRGGYTVYKNDAHPVDTHEYAGGASLRHQVVTIRFPDNKPTPDWSREDD